MYKKILIVKPSSLGDIIHSLPLLKAIKEGLPEASVHWVVAKGFEDLLLEHPLLDRVFVINKQNWKNPLKAPGTIKEILGIGKKLREERYDVVIDLQGLLRSGIITALSRAPVRIGFSDAREMSPLFYNLKIEGGKDIHAVDRYLKIASLLQIQSSKIGFPLPPLGKNPVNENRYFVIVPGARWQSKRWPAEYFADVTKELAKMEFRAVLVGAGSDIDLAEKITSLSETNVLNLAGKTNLKGLCSVIKDSTFVLTNDSGPMHIASALDIPVFAIFGPTSEIRTGPYGSKSRVIKSSINCRPCFKKRCNDIRCMYDVTPEEVVRTIKEALNL